MGTWSLRSGLTAGGPRGSGLTAGGPRGSGLTTGDPRGSGLTAGGSRGSGLLAAIECSREAAALLIAPRSLGPDVGCCC